MFSGMTKKKTYKTIMGISMSQQTFTVILWPLFLIFSSSPFFSPLEDA